ncbi:MAG: alanine--tRNA ligase [Anaerolineaceae bacterium]|nr:alanine--tRNA ligase [Anaerolineaceae bacterium]
MKKQFTGTEIRQSFIDFFTERGHTFVPSASLVPGGDSTLLFTNAGMVQFKDVFLGTDKRPYTRAVNSQKCMRVSGKHNDLDQVGRDDTHHTFFEMLGNWSFGDYYKKEAIAWSWELLTEVWGLPKEHLWATYFKDERSQIPEDIEAAMVWKDQPGFDPTHLIAYGRKDNFWEMAEIGPCGPSSEIHYDFGPQACKRNNDPEHNCHVNGDCGRWVEIWNNVFIQYNRLSADELTPLPYKHVDTGMGLERVVSIIQGVSSNYATDLLSPLLDSIQQLAGQTKGERNFNITPYRVIADHVRAATFLIADGVNPGNVGRNYICRMIIRRAARFAGKIGLTQPFMRKIAEIVINNYSDAYPELKRNQEIILNNITREEERFGETLEAGMAALQLILNELDQNGLKMIDGETAFDLYASLGLPLEITRDIAEENGYEVDEPGFKDAMEEHRLASGAGKAFGEMGGTDVGVFALAFNKLLAEGKLSEEGVTYDPYNSLEIKGEVMAIFKDGKSINKASPNDKVEVLLPETCFYIESGGQVSDSGMITSDPSGKWKINITDVRQPAAGVIVHIGEVISGYPQVSDPAIGLVDEERRMNIKRNHTATHLLHAQLHNIVGSHARQAGSLVAPDRLRFDFANPQPLTTKQILEIEAAVNKEILAKHSINTTIKPLQQAIDEGAMALFGEKYSSSVRTITIGDETSLSYELCGGTHVNKTSEIGSFLIIFEGGVAAGIRRIEAITGLKAYEYARARMNALDICAQKLSIPQLELPSKIDQLLDAQSELQKEISNLRLISANLEFRNSLDNVSTIMDIPVLTAIIENADNEILRSLTDQFRQKYKCGIVVLGSVINGKPLIIAAVTQDLINRGLHAGNLVREIAKVIEGGGGGKPDLAQAGGNNPAKLSEALDQVRQYVKNNLKV